MIAGLQKMSLVDFPGKVACTLFLRGCNYRCPFCHNSELIGAGENALGEEEFFAFLSTRRGLLDGVCISGGEPTLSPELPALLRRIRALGFATKLDTNGSRPAVLKALVAEGLLDYVAVDAKNGPARWGQTVGLERPDLAAVEESLRFLLQAGVDYELRTTLVEPLHDEDSILDMGRWLGGLVDGKKPRRLFLQSFVDRDTVLFSGLSAPGDEKVARYAEILRPFVEEVTVRGG